MSDDTSIDDDALLSGLPSWNDKMKFPNRNTIANPTESGSADTTIESTTQQKMIPSITTITPEDDKRMALRMAALKTLKTRPTKKQVQKAPEANSGDEVGPMNNAECIGASTSFKQDNNDVKCKSEAGEEITMNMNVETIKQPMRPVIQRSFDYTDIDAPGVHLREDLDYIPIENEEISFDVQSTRKRISYADEFSAHPVAPSGDDGSTAWLNRMYDASSRSALNLSDRKSQHQHMENSGLPITRAQMRERSSAGRFIEEPWRPIIIEWSDDEDEDGNEDDIDDEGKEKECNMRYTSGLETLRTTSASRLSSPRPSHSPRTQNKDKSSTLSLKEREIQNMMAKIKELESRKCQAKYDNNHSASNDGFKSTLGKRSTEEFQESMASQFQEDMEMQEPSKVSRFFCDGM